jgi:hypothetical protein
MGTNWGKGERERMEEDVIQFIELNEFLKEG